MPIQLNNPIVLWLKLTVEIKISLQEGKVLEEENRNTKYN